jgi:hypothetical protein
MATPTPDIFLDLESSVCTIDLHANASDGGRDEHKLEGFGVPCSLPTLYDPNRDLPRLRSDIADSSGYSGDCSLYLYARGYVQVWGEFFASGPTYRFDFQSYMETSTAYSYFGSFSGCPHEQDLAAIGEIHFLWTVNRSGLFEYRSFRCESDGRTTATATFFGDEVFPLTNDCDDAPIVFFMDEGDTIAFDVRLNETREDDDSELNSGITLSYLPEPSGFLMLAAGVAFLTALGCRHASGRPANRNRE